MKELRNIFWQKSKQYEIGGKYEVKPCSNWVGNLDFWLSTTSKRSCRSDSQCADPIYS